MKRPVGVLAVIICGLAMVASGSASQGSGASTTVRVYVDVPDAPGTKVTLRYLEGPDSLKGRTQQVLVPADFLVHGQPLTLLAERSAGHGSVRLRVEQVGSSLMGEGTGDRVRIAVANDGVQVRAFPWWLPW
jgi:hypothetical protein